MIDVNDFKWMPICEVCTMERAKPEKEYAGGSTLVQLSATRGNVEFLEKSGTVACHYAVLSPRNGFRGRYVYHSIEKAFPEFIYKYQTGINLQFDTLKDLVIPVHRSVETQKYVEDVMVTIDGLVQKEQAACDGYNMVKQFYLRTMFV